MQNLHPAELAEWLTPDAARAARNAGSDARDAGSDARGAGAPLLLDVREHWEYALCSLPDSIHVPMREIPARLNELDPSQPIVCICHHGVRSLQVAMFLEHRGFESVFNLQGGVDGWAREVDPTMPIY